MRILVVDDDRSVRVTLSDDLSDAGHEVVSASDGNAALDLARAARTPFDCIVTDVKMPGLDGTELVRRVREFSPQTVFIVMTGFPSLESSLAGIRLGIYDYLPKPFMNREVVFAVEKIARIKNLEREVERLQSGGAAERVGRLVGESGPMRDVYATVRTVASSDANVLVVGESGTGKELIAEALHELSPRVRGPLVKASCAAFAENLLEDELFGHEPGAFTGAVSRRKGRLELADGGTLFLDDIDDMRIETQVKLLRVLQERQFERLGSSQSIRTDFRLIAAAKRPLAELVRDGRFREDLYYRIDVVNLKLPPLRERLDDVPVLVNHFVNIHSRDKAVVINPDDLLLLKTYAWPGNVRELENLVERALAFAADGETLKLGFYLDALRQGANAAECRSGEDPLLLTHALERAEREQIEKALRAADGRRGQAAKLLGISRKSLWEKINRHGIDAADA